MILFGEVGILFIVLTAGLLLGSVKIKGKGIGISGVLIAGLVAGHFGFKIPAFVQSFGIVLFVTAVGLFAGMAFKESFIKYAKAYVVITVVTLGLGFAFVLFMILQLGFKTDLVVGMLMGALTSTPGLAAAVEVFGGSSTVGVGYALAYPMGVLGVVGGIQLLAAAEGRKRARDGQKIELADEGEQKIDGPAKGGIFSLSVIIIIGLLIGSIPIPLPWIGSITMGIAGGPLIVAIIFGRYKKVGPMHTTFAPSALALLRDFGAVFILAQVGTGAGEQIVELAKQYGLTLIIAGCVVTFLSVAVIHFLASKLFRFDFINELGTIAGVMTSTPGLATSVDLVGNDDPAVAYSSTYPIAIVINTIIAKILAYVILSM